MQYKITAPERIQATINLPASKSISNRALMIHALAGGDTLPDNLSDCDDTEVIIRALAAMPYEIDIKAAGTAMRFMTAYLSVTEGKHLLTGTDRMKRRPIAPLVNALRYLGADIRYAGETGFPPLIINGKTLEGGRLEVPGNISSQYISALLMIGPALKEGLELHLTGEIISRPYIDLTLWTMQEFGAEAEWTDMDIITVRPQVYKSHPYLIENDWSASSYWYEMLALQGASGSSIKLKGLTDGSKQGDSVVKYLFSLLGVKTTFDNKEEGQPTTVTLTRHRCLLPRLDYDFTLARFGTDLCRDMCVAGHSLHVYRFGQSENQGDRPHRGFESRNEKIGLSHQRREQQHPALGRRALHALSATYRHLRRPSHGIGFCPGCLSVSRVENQQSGRGEQILSPLLGRFAQSGIQH